jgi:peptidoglycan/LPS O-acetylase OafA/YrhL
LAVAAVFSGHLLGLPQGGALGVDVFFVISGFLITGGLMREWEATGTISLRNFYSRRARRILPAALVVLLCVTAVSLVIRSVELTPSPLRHGLASLFFVENWYRAHLGESPEPLSAVQHYWSLSIEEQFYLIWPLTLLVLLWLARMAPVRSRAPGAVAVVLALVAAASLLWAAKALPGDAYGVYHATAGRVWELAAGGVLALVGWRARVAPAARGLAVLAAVGVLLIVMLTKSGPETYPGSIFALVTVIATMVVLALGEGAGGPAAMLLGLRPVQFLGRISYSLYLWNWPVILLVGVVLGRTRGYIVAAALLSLVLAAVTYYFVEEPARRGSAFRLSRRLTVKAQPVTPEIAADSSSERDSSRAADGGRSG